MTSKRYFLKERTSTAVGLVQQTVQIAASRDLTLFVRPQTPENALVELLSQRTDVPLDEAAAALRDLIDLGVVVPIKDANPRNDRHHLYFSLLGIEADHYDQAVSDSTIGIIGAGGLGSSVAMLLAAAGIGKVIISDGDYLELSNLTRSVLYREADIGKPKVVQAAEQLLALNHKVEVRTVESEFDGPEMIYEHFSDCDVIVLTADRPSDVHVWVDTAARRLNIPYLTAGYIETRAAVGPFVEPGISSCYQCYSLARPDHGLTQLNTGVQAASYGPLNTLSASIAANEVIRYLLNLPLRTSNNWALIDSVSLKPEFIFVPPHPKCNCGASGATPKVTTDLADLYALERETTSLNKELLDALVINRALEGGNRILDLGAGIGTIARALAKEGKKVTAIEKSAGMLREFKGRTSPNLLSNIQLIEGDIEDDDWGDEPYDLILAILVLDHLSNPGNVLQRCKQSLAYGGRLLLVVPHPFKDSGHWKEESDGTDLWVLREYFSEGMQRKSRFTQAGECTLSDIETHKWTLGSLSSFITQAGFVIKNIEEPRPSSKQAASSLQLNRADKIPYFLMFDCIKMP